MDFKDYYKILGVAKTATADEIKKTIRAAKRNNIKVGLCEQAPSDIPAFAKFLVEEGIDSISFNADALIKGIENITRVEKNENINILNK